MVGGGIFAVLGLAVVLAGGATPVAFAGSHLTAPCPLMPRVPRYERTGMVAPMLSPTRAIAVGSDW